MLILDEAHAIPPTLLRPTLAAIDGLARNYRCTVVLCAATHPAVLKGAHFPIGLDGVTEIVPDPLDLYQGMKRVRVTNLGPTDDASLIQQVAERPQALCIVNTRAHACELVAAFADQRSCIHLSAALCTAHRSHLVTDIRRRLHNHEPIRVVSTQVIEAGADVDFPVVFRALAGFRFHRSGRRPM